MENNYHIKDSCLIENDNGYSKYVPFGVCGYPQYYYGKLFKSGCWHDLTDITDPEGKNHLRKGYCHANVHECYKYGGDHILPDYPQLKHTNSNSNGGCGLDGRGSHGHGTGNGIVPSTRLNLLPPGTPTGRASTAT